MRQSILVSLCPFLLLAPGVALACGDGNVLFEDGMSPPKQSWGFSAEDETRSIGPDGVTWKLNPNTAWTPFNQTSLYADFELCLTTTVDYPESSGGYVGVNFWSVDTDNNYSIDIFPKDGSFAGYRIQSGKTLKPVPYQHSDAIKTEAKASNEIDLVVRGSHAVVFINGTQVTEFDGIPPDGGGLVGLDMGTTSTDSGPTSVTFTSFQVRSVPDEKEESSSKGK